MSCSFAHDDAAYVLGALSPAERLAFERHLAECADCTRSVRAIAGLPGLLSRVDPEVLEGPTPGSPPLPEPTHLLAATARASRRSRLRRTALTAATAAAAAAVVTALVVPQVTSGDRADSSAPAATAGTPHEMAPVGDVPVKAELAVARASWGTRLELTCTYDTGLVSFALPPAVDYVLVVQTRDGHVERVGSWRSVDGRTMRMSSGTAASPGQIEAVEVRTRDGRVVLTTAV